VFYILLYVLKVWSEMIWWLTILYITTVLNTRHWRRKALLSHITLYLLPIFCMYMGKWHGLLLLMMMVYKNLIGWNKILLFLFRFRSQDAVPVCSVGWAPHSASEWRIEPHWGSGKFSLWLNKSKQTLSLIQFPPPAACCSRACGKG